MSDILCPIDGGMLVPGPHDGVRCSRCGADFEQPSHAFSADALALVRAHCTKHELELVEFVDDPSGWPVGVSADFRSRGTAGIGRWAVATIRYREHVAQLLIEIALLRAGGARE